MFLCWGVVKMLILLCFVQSTAVKTSASKVLSRANNATTVEGMAGNLYLPDNMEKPQPKN